MSRTNPGLFPSWLFDRSQAGALHGSELWLCSVCGAPYWRRPGEPIRLEGPCWRSREYGVSCTTPRGERVLYPASMQPSLEAEDQGIEPTDKWDHSACAQHVRHPAFKKKLCVLPSQNVTEVVAFADEIAAIA